MSTSTTGPRATFLTAADYSAKQFYIVWLSGQTATLADDADVQGENILGTIQNKPSANTGATLDVHLPFGGIAKVIAGGTIAVGDELTTDANGKAIATTTADDNLVGVALDTAVAGDIFRYIPKNGRYEVIA